MSINRIARYFGHDGACLMVSKTVDVAERTAATISKAIADRWGKDDKDLANAAGVSHSALSLLKTQGALTVTKVLRKTCFVLRIDPTAVLQGQIVEANPVSSRSDLHALLDKVIGTIDEPTIERMLKAIVNTQR